MKDLTKDEMKIACELPAVFVTDLIAIVENDGLRLSFTEQTARGGLFVRASVMLPHDRAKELFAAITWLFENVETPDTDTSSSRGQTH